MLLVLPSSASAHTLLGRGQSPYYSLWLRVRILWDAWLKFLSANSPLKLGNMMFRLGMGALEPYFVLVL